MLNFGSLRKMPPSEKDLRDRIVDAGRLMYSNKWVASNDGNISVRLDAERVLITPTGISKGLMHPEDLVIVDSGGRKIEGEREPTSEIAMHLAIYAQRPDVQAVVHAHPPFATGFALAGRALNLALMPEVIVNLGVIPLAGYGLPGTPELTATMLPLIASHDAILLANHGAVTYGPDLSRAVSHMETLEHVAHIAMVAETLGGPCLLQTSDVDKLIGSRARYGVSPRLSEAIRPQSREEYEALEMSSSDAVPATRVGLRRFIRQELGIRLAELLNSAGVRLTIVTPGFAQSRIGRAFTSKTNRSL